MSDINFQIFLLYENREQELEKINHEMNKLHSQHHYLKAAQSATSRYVDNAAASIPTNLSVINHISPIAKASRNNLIFPADLYASSMAHSSISGGLSGIFRGLAGNRLKKFKELEKRRKELDPDYKRTHRFNRSNGIPILQGKRFSHMIDSDTLKKSARKNRILHHLDFAAGGALRSFDNIQTMPAKILQKTLSSGSHPSSKFYRPIKPGSKLKVYTPVAKAWNDSDIGGSFKRMAIHTLKAGASVPYETLKHLRVKPNEKLTKDSGLKLFVHAHLQRHPEQASAAKSIGKNILKFQRWIDKDHSPKIGNPIGSGKK